MKHLSLVTFLMIILSGCSSLYQNQKDNNSYINSMMISENCLNPCWLGIEAGMTISINDVEQILKSYYGEENAYISNVGKNPSPFTSISWRIHENKSDTFESEFGTVTLDNNSQVKSVTVFFSEATDFY